MLTLIARRERAMSGHVWARLLVFLSVAGCGHGPPRARQAPAAAAPRESRVFLLRFAADLVPFGCYDARENQLRPGESCRDLIDARPEVRVVQVEGGQPRERTLPVTATPVHFIASDQTVDGYRLNLPCPPNEDQPHPPCAGPKGTAGFFAAWPPGFAPTLAPRPDSKRLWAPSAAGENGPLPREVVEELTPLLRDCKTGEVPPLAVHQRLRLDLDGDGVPEELLTVRAQAIEADSADDANLRLPGVGPCLPADVDRPSHWFFLYVKRGPRFVRVPLGPLPSDAPFAGGSGAPGVQSLSADGEVLGSFDLDGDGAQELWLEQPYYEGRNWVVVRLRGGIFEVLDHFVDGT
jgi:hypothetical protein